MEFYQFKNYEEKEQNLRYGDGCLVPADTDFAKLAAMLEDILEYADTENYEFEFFQKKLRLQNLEAQTAEATKGNYEYAEAKGRQNSRTSGYRGMVYFQSKRNGASGISY